MSKSNAEQYYDSVVSLCGSNRLWVHFYYTAYLVSTSGDLIFDKVLSIERTKDYENNWSDNIVLEISCTKQFYIQSLYPVRDSFKIRLHAEQQTENYSGFTLQNPETWSRTYAGKLVNPIDMTSSEYNPNPLTTTDTNADKAMVSIKIQLIPLAQEQLALMAMGGNFVGTPGDILKTAFTEAINTSHFTDLPYGEELTGVDLVDPAITETYYDMAIEHGTKLLKWPELIQKQWGGIYNHGIGHYIYKQTWCIYPLYKYDRWDTAKIRLTLSIIPRASIMDSKRTYHVKKGEVNIVSCEVKVNKDTTGILQSNLGDGVTFYDTSKTKQEVVSKTEDGVTVDGQVAKAQVVMNEREDGLSSAPNATEKLTSSMADVASQVAARNATVMTFIWEWSNHEFLIPGMPVKVVFYKEDKRYEVTGILLKEVTVTQLQDGLTNKKHTNVTALGVVVDSTQLKTIEKEQYEDLAKGTRTSLLSGLF